MAERNEERPRTCDKCGAKIVTTTPGIKKHAASCKGKGGK